MTKLIIQIPCYNEEQTLPAVLAELPTEIPGIDCIETLVIDDGSTDATVAVARDFGVTYIIQHNGNKGLARAFQTGLDTCLQLGADMIVNTDGDHQYPGRYVPDLVAPILAHEADLVIADRRPGTIEHFSPVKKLLQSWGSWVVRLASGTHVPDAPCGFRSYSREAALQLFVLTDFTYTLETIIQAGKKGLRLRSVPITVNPKFRESRLFKSNWGYVKRSAAAILRIYTFYEPLRTFFYLSLPFLLPGLFLLGRFTYFYLIGDHGIGRHLQSFFVGGIAVVIGLLIVILGVLADLSATNRRLTEEMLYQLKSQYSHSSNGRVQKNGLDQMTSEEL